MEQEERDAWHYLGVLFVVGDYDRTDWALTRRLIEFAGGEEALIALEVCMSTCTLGIVPKERLKEIDKHKTPELLERFKSSVDDWLNSLGVIHPFDILQVGAFAHENELPALHGDLFYHWSKVPENNLIIAKEYTESPIEEALAVELAKRGCAMEPPERGDDYQGFRDTSFPACMQLQREIGNFRVDFLVTAPETRGAFVVECDGHDFHERTKQQAQRDKGRDRQILAQHGWPTIRFTGSEIYRDVTNCADEVLAHAARLSPYETT